MESQAPNMGYKTSLILFLIRRAFHQALCILKESPGYPLMATWQAALFFYLPGSFAGIPPFDMDAAILAYLGTSLTGLVTLLLTRRPLLLCSRRFFTLGAGAVGMLGIILIGLAPFTEGQALCCIGFFVSAVGFAFLTIAWLQRFIAQGLDSVAWYYLTSTFTGMGIFVLAVLLTPDVCIVAFALCPPVAALSMRTDIVRDSQKTPEEMPHLFKAIDEQAQPPAKPTKALLAPLFAVVTALFTAVAAIINQSAAWSNTVDPRGWVMQIILGMSVCLLAKALASSAYLSGSLLTFNIVIPVICMGSVIPLMTSNIVACVTSYMLSLLGLRLIGFIIIFKIAELYHPRPESVTPVIGAYIFVNDSVLAIGALIFEALDSTMVDALVVLSCMVTVSLVIANFRDSFSITVEHAIDGRMAQIHAVALRFDLTSRETDILELWGEGHTSTFLEQKLGISKNTIKSHLTHIYEKTSTANKEELLQLIASQPTGKRP